MRNTHGCRLLGNCSLRCSTSGIPAVVARGHRAAMKVIVFGATGMVGQGVLRECLLDPRVAAVLTVGRKATGQSHPKLKELVHADLFEYGSVAAELKGYDACF